MSTLQNLKKIAENQKTVRTSRLLPLIKKAEREYIDQAKRIKRQNKELNRRSNQ